MGSITRTQVGDITYEAFGANVRGGRLIVPVTGTTVSGAQGAQEAGADSQIVLGVSEKDAVTEANVDALTNLTGGAPSSNFVTDASVPTATFTVYNDAVVSVSYKVGTAVGYGQRIKSAANGEATLWVSGTDSPACIVGWCAVKGGMGAGGGVGKARISV